MEQTSAAMIPGVGRTPANPTASGRDRNNRNPLPALVAGIAALLAPLAVGTVLAGDWEVDADHSWCEDGKWNSSFCEVRTLAIPAGRSSIVVDAGKNGGIEVRGTDTNEIKIWARVILWDVYRDEAEELAREVRILTDDDIGVEAPSHLKYAVSFRIEVPRDSNLDLVAYNGGISVENVDGTIEFDTHNGGIRLENVAGDVEGFTMNGGIVVQLEGRTWDGDGLNVETRNGGVQLMIPEDYSARLVTGTTNGSLYVGHGFDLDVGRKTKRVRTTLGSGGALLRVVTTNGGVKIEAV